MRECIMLLSHPQNRLIMPLFSRAGLRLHYYFLSTVNLSPFTENLRLIDSRNKFQVLELLLGLESTPFHLVHLRE